MFNGVIVHRHLTDFDVQLKLLSIQILVLSSVHIFWFNCATQMPINPAAYNIQCPPVRDNQTTKS